MIIPGLFVFFLTQPRMVTDTPSPNLRASAIRRPWVSLVIVRAHCNPDILRLISLLQFFHQKSFIDNEVDKRHMSDGTANTADAEGNQRVSRRRFLKYAAA